MHRHRWVHSGTVAPHRVHKAAVPAHTYFVAILVATTKLILSGAIDLSQIQQRTRSQRQITNAKLSHRCRSGHLLARGQYDRVFPPLLSPELWSILWSRVHDCVLANLLPAINWGFPDHYLFPGELISVWIVSLICPWLLAQRPREQQRTGSRLENTCIHVHISANRFRSKQLLRHSTTWVWQNPRDVSNRDRR